MAPYPVCYLRGIFVLVHSGHETSTKPLSQRVLLSKKFDLMIVSLEIFLTMNYTELNTNGTK